MTIPTVVLSVLCLWMLRPGAVLAQPVSFDGQAAFELLEKQVEFGPRNPGSEAHDRMLSWMIRFLKQRAEEVTPHTFVMQDPYSDGKLQLTNVKASFRPELRRRLALGAHWDCRPFADRDSGEAALRPIAGANDGASGVAVLLQLAEILRDHPPTVGVDLLFFDGEDYGKEGQPQHYLLGSRRFVRDFPAYRPEAFILLDMIGDADLRIPIEGFSFQQAPELAQMVFQRAQMMGLTAFQPVQGRQIMDDHLPFLQKGIPSLDLIDFDYPPWHTQGDLPQACSPASLRQVGQLLLGLIFLDFSG